VLTYLVGMWHWLLPSLTVQYLSRVRAFTLGLWITEQLSQAAVYRAVPVSVQWIGAGAGPLEECPGYTAIAASLGHNCRIQ
jgi:hypothetical protein